jgi:hypothetical protein
MLTYAIVQAAGYYAQRSDVAMLAMFACFAALTLAMIVPAVRQP